MKILPLSITAIIFLLSITFVLPSVHGISGSALFMKSNSTAKIYAEFTFRALSHETWNLSPGLYTSLTDPSSQTKDISIVASPSSFIGNTTHVKVTYTITAKGDAKGVYALFLHFCGLSPLMIGLDYSEVNPATLKEFFTVTYNCPAMTESVPDMNIVGYSGIVSKNITINPNGTISVTSVDETEALDSPLKQFKSGIAAHDIACKEGLQLIIKSEDESPVCVKLQTAERLVARGWAHGSSDGPVVYFMKSNSIAKISVEYDSAQSDAQTNLNARIYNSTTMYQIPPTEIGTTVNPSVVPAHSNTTVVYTITSHDTSGLFWLSLDACSFVPIAIDLDNSKITNSDLQPWIAGWRCPVSLLHYKIVDGLEGITPEYVRVR